MPRIMTSIGPKAPISTPALPSEEVTPANPATEQHEQDPRGRDPEKPAAPQEVSAEDPAPQTPTSPLVETAIIDPKIGVVVDGRLIRFPVPQTPRK